MVLIFYTAESRISHNLNMGIPLHFLSESWTGEQSPLFSQVRENCIRMKTCSTVFLAIAITVTPLTNRCSTKISLLWHEVLMMLLSVPQSLKILSKYTPT